MDNDVVETGENENINENIYVDASFFKDVFDRFFSDVRERYCIYFLQILLKMHQKDENEDGRDYDEQKDLMMFPEPPLKKLIEGFKLAQLRDPHTRRVAISLLIPLLREKDATIRAIVTEILGNFKKETPLEPIIMALKDPIWDVRAAAAQTLGKLDCEEALPVLLSSLEDEYDENVREAIVRSIGKFKYLIPIETLGKILLTDPDWLVREAAAWSLGELGEAAPVEYLIYAFRNDQDEMVRAAAAESLGKSRNKQAKKLLQDAKLKGEHEDVILAIEAALKEFEKNKRSFSKEDPLKREGRREGDIVPVLRGIFCEEEENSTESPTSEKNIIGFVKYDRGEITTGQLYQLEATSEENIEKSEREIHANYEESKKSIYEAIYKIESISEEDFKKLEKKIRLKCKAVDENIYIMR